MALDLSQQAGGPTGAASGTGGVLLVVPTLGHRPAMLAETLESLLEQRDVDLDVVLVAPPGAAQARRLAAGHGLTVLDDPGRGLAAAVNAGLASAGRSHRYGNWITEDDVLLPGALAVAVAELSARPDAVLAYGDCRFVTDDGNYLFTPRAGRHAGLLTAWRPQCLAQPAGLFRLDALVRAGGLDESLRHAHDLDLHLRLRRLGGFVDTGRTLCTFRWRPRGVPAQERAAAARESVLVRSRYLPPPLHGAAQVGNLPLRTLTRHALAQTQRSAAWTLISPPSP